MLQALDVILATPCKTGYIWIDTAEQVAKFQVRCADREIRCHWWTIRNDPYVDAARDAMANRFLDRTKATHLFFLDDDVVFQPDQIFEILGAGKDIVAGVYPQKKIDWDVVREASKKYSGSMLDHVSCPPWLFLGEGLHRVELTVEKLRAPLEVEAAATGFMCISRHALEVFREKEPDRYWNTRYGDQPMTPFFAFGRHKQTQMRIGEDINFCLRMKEMGIPTHIIPAISLGHVGAHVHHGCPWCLSGPAIHKILDPEVKHV